MEFFHLRVARGLWLSPGADGLVTMTETADPATALLLCVPRGGPQTSFLIAPDARAIQVEGDGLGAAGTDSTEAGGSPAISARLRSVPGGPIELRHPLAPVRYLGVVFGVPGARPNRVLFDRVGDAVLDRLTPHPVDAAALPATALALAAELALASRPPIRAARVMALLHAGRVRLELAEALVRALPTDELQMLARRSMDSPADLALLRRAIPRDLWLQHALPGLLDWDKQGRPRTRRAVSAAAEDHVSVLQSGALRPQAGLALQALARRTISPNRLAAVLATVRNEGPYLLDWLAHHRAAGFDHAVIYSNDNDDGSDELLGALADAGEISWVRNELGPASRPQWKAYGHAFKMLPDLTDYRWTLVIDLDEYFVCQPDMFSSVAEFVGWHEHQAVDAIALRWLNFIGGRDDVWRDEPSTQRFVRREPAVSPLFKSLVRSNQFWDSHCHFPFPTMDAPFTYRLEDGAPCNHMAVMRGLKMPKDAVTAERAWIAHHMYRSAGEALMKVARGDALWRADAPAEATRLDAVVQRFVALAAKPGLVEDRRTMASVPEFAAQSARLRELPGVAAADIAVKQRFAERLRAVSQAFVSASFGGEKPGYLAFQSILREQGLLF